MTIGDGIALASMPLSVALIAWAYAWMKVRAGQMWTDIATHDLQPGGCNPTHEGERS